MTFEIKQILASQTWPIRHQVMWPNQPFAYIQLANDTEGKHYGLYIDQQLVSVISLFRNAQSVQFRKLATLEDFQGKGYGTALLQNIFEILKKEDIDKVWCNARLSKSKFYKKFGMKETNQNFEKGGIEYILMEKEI